MMLRKRSRAVGSKKGLMADSQLLSSSTETKENKPTGTSLFPSPRILAGLSPRSLFGCEATKSLNSFTIPNFSDVHPMKTPPAIAETKTAAIGEGKHGKTASLGILEVLDDDDDNTEKLSSKKNSRKVLFASQLKIQVPLISPKLSASVAPLEFPSSPIEFGIKNKDSQLALFSPAQRIISSELPVSSPRVPLLNIISVSEMELSEDYTRVVAHGPNPRTTHIYDNCIVESCADEFISVA